MEAFEGWAILELMGHKTIAGFVRDAELFGKPTIAVDLTVTGGTLTQFYSPDALYCLTPTTEENVKTVQGRMNDPFPVHRWGLPALAAPEGDDDTDYDDIQYED